LTDEPNADGLPSSVTIHDLLGLRGTTTPGQWHVDVHDGVQTGSRALHGGSAFGATIEAMVATTGRAAIWTTAQFVAYAGAGTTLDLTVDVAASGHRVTQARAQLRHGEELVLTALGAFGDRAVDGARTWATPPDVPQPENCPPRTAGRESLVDLWRSRVASGRTSSELDGTPGPGRSASWYRLPDGPRSVTAGDLAVLGDFTVLELHDAFGAPLSANSLDNTLRVGELGTCEWVLLDTHVSMAARGFVSVTANLWSDTGALLGVASQSLVLRQVGSDGLPIRTTKRFAGPPVVGDDSDTEPLG